MQLAIIKKILNDFESFILTHPQIKFRTIYIGGGTPSVLSEDNWAYFFNRLRPLIFDRMEADSGSQFFTVEVNPESLTKEKLDIFKKNYVSRLSIGIQSFSENVLEAIGRPTKRVHFDNLKMYLKDWNGALSFDIIAGLPNQTPSTLVNDLSTAIDWGARHISLYCLEIDENSLLWKNKELYPGPWQKEEYRHELWDIGSALLEENYFNRYEISNFAQIGHESLHNRQYWDLGVYYGFGPGATSNWFDTKGTMYRHTAIENFSDFLISSWDGGHLEILDSSEILKDLGLMGFRTQWGLNIERWESMAGLSWETFSQSLSKEWVFIKKFNHVILKKEQWDFLDAFLIHYFEKIDFFLKNNQNKLPPF